ncbi:MAG: 50S ribosomal protein L6 [Candidatus Methanofastidiosa archaeon]|nr:50S ribosomal protein L6 [Candidatus Methanofastidiosa archaeon]
MLADEIREEIIIPNGIEVEVSNHYVKIKGPLGSLERRFKYPNVRLESKANAIVLVVDYPRKVDKAAIYTIRSHLRNMLKGVQVGFKYRMKIIYAHFPLNIKLDGDKVVIDNYLGEKFPRNAKVVGTTKVNITGDEIVVEGINKEHVGQTVGNLEKATRVIKRDPRVFQDGIYLIERDGVPLRW